MNKEVVQSMAKAVGTYKLLRQNIKQKCRVDNRVVEEVVYPSQLRASLNGRGGKKRVSEGGG